MLWGLDLRVWGSGFGFEGPDVKSYAWIRVCAQVGAGA